MKYLIGGLFAVLFLGMLACSNDQGTGNIKRRSNIDYRDLRIFKGSEKGAIEVFPDTIKLIRYLEIKRHEDEDGNIIKSDTIVLRAPDTIFLNVDSLYRELVMNLYFRSIYTREVQPRNNITFEFLPDEPTLLRYVDSDLQGRKTTYISPYRYEDNELQILKGGVTPLYVVSIDEVTGQYYRTLGLILPWLQNENKNEENKEDETKFTNREPLDPIDKEVVTLESALKKIGFDDPKDFTNPNDSVIWANLKYYYR